MNATAEQWENVIGFIAADEAHDKELIETAINVCGRSWFESFSQSLEDLHHNITGYLETSYIGTYDGSTEELYNLITGESVPRYFDAEQWQYDLECDGWSFEPVTLDTYAAFRP
jgi:hypothetical protein